MKLIAIAGGAAAALLLSACAGGPGLGPAYAPGPIAFEGYYDDFYGPFYDGYWGVDGLFYYRPNAGAAFRRDAAHHFSRQAAPGMHPVHGRAAG